MPLERLAGIRTWLSKQLVASESDNKEQQSLTGTRRSRFRLLIICAVIFFASLAVRFLYFQDMRGEVLYEESLATTMIYKYEEEKQRMLNDGGLLFPGNTVDPADARMLFHPPGHSILLAALYGNDTPDRYYTALRLLQVFCGALASVLIVLIAAQLLPLAVAVIVGLLASLSPHFAYYSLWLTPDSLCVLPILAAIWLLILGYKRPRLLTIIAAGAMLGLSVWLRTNALLLAPFLALVIVLVFERGKRLRYSAALLFATAAVISPITIRNWVVYHRFVPVTLGNGLLLVEGIAEYDEEGRFGLSPYDGQVCLIEAQWYGRRDYRNNPWVPDGIDRDRARFNRGLEIIRSNPAWSLGMIRKRMAFMVRYNDFRPTALSERTSRAPSVYWTPPFGHNTEVTPGIEPVFTASPQDFMSDTVASSKIAVSLADGGQEVQVSGQRLSKEDIFISAPVALKTHTDYLLRVSAGLEQGNAVVKVKSADLRLALGEKALARIAAQPISVTEIPFASGHQAQTRLAISSNSQEATETSVKVGRMELIELGPTPYQWTRPFRAAIRALQQNIFKTDYMRLLIVIGITLLALAHQRRVLLILLAVPLYYLFSHAPFGIDYRYILPMHYFLFIFAAVTLYCAGTAVAQATRRAKHLIGI
jgi:hypothetical protein